MKKRFYYVDGQMVGCDEGGVRKDFLTDHLGSIIAEVDQDENVTYQARYSAFGQPKSSTGTGWGFGWIGSYGYRETGLPHMSHYVRARHYSEVTGNWSTVDPLWPDESAYGYVGGRATSQIDPTGNFYIKCPGCTQVECNAMAAAIGPMLSQICPGGDPSNPDGFADCVDRSGCRQPMGGSSPGAILCGIPSRPFITITCDRKCKPMPNGTKRCAHGWKGSGFTVCMPQALGAGCGPFGCLFLHEIIHMAGIPHGKDNDPAWNCINNIPGCERYK
jgi:RHS repeat-associated protein